MTRAAKKWKITGMTGIQHAYRRLIPVLLAFSVTGCAVAPKEETAVFDSFSRPAAREVFSVGFSNIAERYIDPMPVSEFVVEGLKGLGSIDPEISIEKNDDFITMQIGEESIGTFDPPDDQDIQGWVNLTVDASTLARKYSDALGDATPEQLYESVFDGILSKMDIYSRYAGVMEAKKNRAKRQGFGGIGIRFVAKPEGAQVTHIIEDSPASRSGIRLGDLITHVGDNALSGLAKEEIGKLLRGRIQSHARLQVLRKKTELVKIDIERAHIVNDTVTYREKDGHVILKISSFNKKTAHNVLVRLKKAHKSMGHRLKGIIVDMRGNPGGLLKQSIKVADLFLAQGRISETRGRHTDSLQQYDAGGRDMAFGKPVVVLLDGKSASAAEVTAAALQDRGRAVVVGTSSFGKGTVQTVVRLPNEGEMTLTWSRLIAPSGYVLHGLGVYPTICTSGIQENKNQTLKKVLADKIKTAAVLEAWRQTAYRDKKRRDELRAFCKPERRKKTTDLQIAASLIADKTLYARAVNLTAAAAAAR